MEFFTTTLQNSTTANIHTKMTPSRFSLPWVTPKNRRMIRKKNSFVITKLRNLVATRTGMTSKSYVAKLTFLFGVAGDMMLSGGNKGLVEVKNLVKRGL